MQIFFNSTFCLLLQKKNNTKSYKYDNRSEAYRGCWSVARTKPAALV